MREADRSGPPSYAYAGMVSLAAVAGKDGSVRRNAHTRLTGPSWPGHTSSSKP
jgi:hypothetical protein